MKTDSVQRNVFAAIASIPRCTGRPSLWLLSVQPAGKIKGSPRHVRHLDPCRPERRRQRICSFLSIRSRSSARGLPRHGPDATGGSRSGSHSARRTRTRPHVRPGRPALVRRAPISAAISWSSSGTKAIPAASSFPGGSARPARCSIGTSTLMERDQPYLLEVELARGMVNCLRNQLAQWEMMGLDVPDALRALMSEGNDAILSRRDERRTTPATAAEWAEKSLDHVRRRRWSSLPPSTPSKRSRCAAASRGRSPPGSASIWAASVPKGTLGRQLAGTFNMVSVPLTWRTIEAVEGRRNWDEADAQVDWAQSAGLRVTAGPLLGARRSRRARLDVSVGRRFQQPAGVHARPCPRRGRTLSRQSAPLASGRPHDARPRARARAKKPGCKLAAKAITTVRQLDPTTPIVVSFDQPWAEYLASEQLDLAPLHFADALVRADLGLSGVGLEINVGYHPGGSMHRGPLAISRLIDTWSLLELPLLVALTLPSSAADDPQANGKVRVLSERRRRRDARIAARLDRAARAAAVGQERRCKSCSGISSPMPCRTTIRTADCSTRTISRSRHSKRSRRSARSISTAK